MNENFVAQPDSTATAAIDTSGANQANSSSFNWNQLISDLGSSAVGLWGNGANKNIQPSGPPMVFQSNNNLNTVLIIVLVLAAIGASIYLIKRK